MSMLHCRFACVVREVKSLFPCTCWNCRHENTDIAPPSGLKNMNKNRLQMVWWLCMLPSLAATCMLFYEWTQHQTESILLSFAIISLVAGVVFGTLIIGSTASSHDEQNGGSANAPAASPQTSAAVEHPSFNEEPVQPQQQMQAIQSTPALPEPAGEQHQEPSRASPGTLTSDHTPAPKPTPATRATSKMGELLYKSNEPIALGPSTPSYEEERETSTADSEPGDSQWFESISFDPTESIVRDTIDAVLSNPDGTANYTPPSDSEEDMYNVKEEFQYKKPALRPPTHPMSRPPKAAPPLPSEPIPLGPGNFDPKEFEVVVEKVDKRVEQAEEMVSRLEAEVARAEKVAARLEVDMSKAAPLVTPNKEEHHAAKWPQTANDEPQAPMKPLPEFSTVEGWLSYSDQMIAEGNFDHAIKCYDKVTKMEPMNFDAWFLKAVALRRKNRCDDAIYCINFALSLRKNSTVALTEKGDCLLQLGRPDQAIVWYDKALMQDKIAVQPWLGKARCLSAMGHLKDAIACYNKILQIQPENEESRNSKMELTAKMQSKGVSRAS